MAKGRKPTPREIYWERKHREEREQAALLPVGFVNHGNTCFMNSVLQGLVATRRLEELIRFESHQPYEPFASHRSPLLTNGRGLKDFQQDWVQGMALGDTFLEILERSWRMRDAREKSSMSPRELVSRLGAKYDQYLDFRQQDAHEFLLHLLDGMRMDEFDIIKRRQPPPPKSKSRRRASDGAHVMHPDPILENERLTSFVDMTFGGKLASILMCETCKHVSQTTEDFDDLSLSITHDESKERMRDRLRTFASKFKSSANRSRDPARAPPMSFSQPPSPPLPPTTLDIPEDAQEEPRRRSLEIPASGPLASEVPKVDLFTNLSGATSDGAAGESSTHQLKAQLHKTSDGLGKLSKRISVTMALAGRKDKKPSKMDQETRASPSALLASEKDTNMDMKTPISAPTSRPHSRQRSPTPVSDKLKQKGKRDKPSEYDAQKAAYLHRLFHDSTASLSNTLAILRTASPIGAGSSSQWTKLGSIQGIEDCLRIFTAVEILDGENKFGCRNCWKVASGQRSDRRNTESDDDIESSEDDRESKPETQYPRPEIVDRTHSFSTPNLPADEVVISSSPPLSSNSTPPVTSVDPPVPDADIMELDSFDMTQAKTSRSIPSASKGSPSLGESVPSDSSLTADPLSPSSIVTDRGLGVLPIPTITAISPPSETSAIDIPSPSINYGDDKMTPPNRVHFHNRRDGYAASSRDSLQLPASHTHRRRDIPRTGESNISSEESEYDDTSGVSDGDGSVVSTPSSSIPLRPPNHGVPRSKQVLYRRALKRYLIASPPPILVIHLKRFQQVSKSPVTLFGNLKKLDEFVSFPEYLDVQPFLAPKKEDYGLGKGELRGKVTEKGKRAEDNPCVYRLYAVVVHIGNMLGGHYIAYTALPMVPEPSHDEANNLPKEHISIKPLPGKAEPVPPAAKERQWCYISDTVVRTASLSEVLKSKAYICMYERLPVP